jgi:hypothetical protein
MWYIRYKPVRNLTSYVVKQMEINRLNTYPVNYHIDRLAALHFTNGLGQQASCLSK